MSFAAIISLVIAVIVLVYLVLIYNTLVTLKNHCSKSLANIDVLLKQRNEELPKLIEVCKRYMQHEKDTLESVVKARSEAVNAQQSHDVTDMGKAETLLGAGLGKLFALAENYPDLKADAAFQDLSERISELENTISDRRELYNESVNNNNTRIAHFPDVLVAKLFSFKAFKLLRFEKRELEDVNLKTLFND